MKKKYDFLKIIITESGGDFMKKSVWAVTAVIFLLTACDTAISSDDSSGSSETTETSYSSGSSSTGPQSVEITDSDETSCESVSYSQSGANVFEISASTSQLTITGLSSGKTIYMTNTNPTATTISSAYTRYVSSASGISLSTGDRTSSSTSST